MTHLLAFASLTLLAASPLAQDEVLPLAIQDVRSVSIYHVQSAWRQPQAFAHQVSEAKALGFNTIWLVVPWHELEPDVGSHATPLPSIGSPSYTGQWDHANEALLRQSLGAIREQGMHVMWAVNYLGHGWSPFGVDPTELHRDPNFGFFLRYSAKAAEILNSEGLADVSFLLCHDEGPISFHPRVHDKPGIQASYRNYLYTKSPDITWWNARWGTSHADFSSIKTFVDDGTSNALRRDPRLQDTLDFINWHMSLSLGADFFPHAVKTAAPGTAIRCGYHYTNASQRNTREPGFELRENPLGANHGYDFVSAARYDERMGRTPWASNASEDALALMATFPGMPIFYGELGAEIYEQADCEGPVSGRTVTFDTRQAQFVGRSMQQLEALGVGYSVWHLVDWVTPTQGDHFGCLDLDGLRKPLGDMVAAGLQGDWSLLDASRPTPHAAGLVVSYTPWAIWITGLDFSPGLRVTGALDGAWAFETSTVFGSSTGVTLQICANWTPQPGNLRLHVWDPRSAVRGATVDLTLP